MEKIEKKYIIMEYQKIVNLLHNTPDQPCKSKEKNWVEINYESRVIYNTNRQVKFKPTKLKSSLCDYCDTYRLISGTITITGEGVSNFAEQTDERNKGIIFKNCVPLTDCISEISNTEIENERDLDIVTLTYNLIECSDIYSKTSGSLWQYYRDKPAFDNDGDVVNFPGNRTSFESKVKITRKAPPDGNTKDVKTAVPLKYLNNFGNTFLGKLLRYL